MPRLSVNIDHIATLREARKTYEPEPVFAAGEALLGGAEGITVHLRQDRRHIKDRDLLILRQVVPFGLNVEHAIRREMIEIMKVLVPDSVCFVPEKPEEVTTEGGLNLKAVFKEARKATADLKTHRIRITAFIEPDARQLRLARDIGCDSVELYTHHYAGVRDPKARGEAFKKLAKAAEEGHKLGLEIHGGHGLNYMNVSRVARLPWMAELSIGHAIIARAVFVGLRQAVREMAELVKTS